MGLRNYWKKKMEQGFEDGFNKTIKEEVEQINLECDGFYSLSVKEANSSYLGHNGFKNKMEYRIYATYKVDVTLENELTSVRFVGATYVKDGDSEVDAYQQAINQSEEFREDVLSAMKRDISRKFEDHVKDNNLDELKRKLENNKDISISFKVSVDKPQ
mgnify:FL=1